MIDPVILDTLSDCAECCYPRAAEGTPVNIHVFFYLTDASDPGGRGWPLEMDEIVGTLESLAAGKHVEQSLTRLLLSGRADLSSSIRARLSSTTQQTMEAARAIERLRFSAAQRANTLCLQFIDGEPEEDHGALLQWADVARWSRRGANPAKCEQLSNAIVMDPRQSHPPRRSPAPGSDDNADDVARAYWAVLDAVERRIRRTRYAVRVSLERLVDHLSLIDEEVRAPVPPTATSKPNVPDPSAPSTSTVDWKDVQGRLMELYKRGGRYTSIADLAVRLGCGKATVQKAIKPPQSALVRLSDAARADARSAGCKLTGWQARHRNAGPALRATSLTEIVTDHAEQTCEPDPAEEAEAGDVEIAFARLIQEAQPEERAQLNNMDDDQRRQMVALWQDDPDSHDRVLGRRP